MCCQSNCSFKKGEKQTFFEWFKVVCMFSEIFLKLPHHPLKAHFHHAMYCRRRVCLENKPYLQGTVPPLRCFNVSWHTKTSLQSSHSCVRFFDTVVMSSGCCCPLLCIIEAVKFSVTLQYLNSFVPADHSSLDFMQANGLGNVLLCLCSSVV